MSLTVAELFYIEHHQDIAPADLAITLNIKPVAVKAALRKLAKGKPQPEAKPQPSPTRASLGGFQTHQGVTTMTPSRASDDDGLIASQPPQISPHMRGIHIMDPSKPTI